MIAKERRAHRENSRRLSILGQPSGINLQPLNQPKAKMLLNRRRLISGLKLLFIYGLIFLVAGFFGNLWLSRNQATGVAPLITGQTMDGQWQNINVADYDGPVLLYFFADWCPICKVQHGAISSINENYPVIAIAMQSGDIQNVKKYLEKQKLDLFVVNDIDSSVSQSYGVQGVPASFVIDQSGNIKYSTRGYATQLGLLGRLWLAQLESS